MKNTYLHYTKDRKPSLKIKNCIISGLCRGLYRRRRVLEDETVPRVEDRRVAPPNYHENAAITPDLREY